MSEHLWVNFSPSCERNKQPIVTEFAKLGLNDKKILEIGSLSGQHACFISEQVQPACWLPSDVVSNLDALHVNIQQNGNKFIASPIALDVAERQQWPTDSFDVIYTANTLHIMSWFHVEQLFNHVPKVCQPGTKLVVYGPFKFDGEYTSQSNAEFDLWLKERDALSAIRDFEAVNMLAEKAGFECTQNINMPANNQMIIWQFI